MVQKEEDTTGRLCRVDAGPSMQSVQCLHWRDIQQLAALGSELIS
jgi:hypothetical protein